MDGDPQNDGTGGLNQTDPIPQKGGKTKADLKAQSGTLTLENMDDALFGAVQSGDESLVRQRLAGSGKLTDAEAAILDLAHEEEEARAYASQQAQDAQTADAHRNENEEKEFLALLSAYNAYNNWSREGEESSAPAQVRDLPAGHWTEGDIANSDPDSFRTLEDPRYKKYLDTDGGYHDKSGGHFDVQKRVYEEPHGGGQYVDGVMVDKDGNYATQGGEKYDIRTHTLTLQGGRSIDMSQYTNEQVLAGLRNWQKSHPNGTFVDFMAGSVKADHGGPLTDAQAHALDGHRNAQHADLGQQTHATAASINSSNLSQFISEVQDASRTRPLPASAYAGGGGLGEDDPSTPWSSQYNCDVNPAAGPAPNSRIASDMRRQAIMSVIRKKSGNLSMADFQKAITTLAAEGNKEDYTGAFSAYIQAHGEAQILDVDKTVSLSASVQPMKLLDLPKVEVVAPPAGIPPSPRYDQAADRLKLANGDSVEITAKDGSFKTKTGAVYDASTNNISWEGAGVAVPEGLKPDTVRDVVNRMIAQTGDLDAQKLWNELDAASKAANASSPDASHFIAPPKPQQTAEAVTVTASAVAGAKGPANNAKKDAYDPAADGLKLAKGANVEITAKDGSFKTKSGEAYDASKGVVTMADGSKVDVPKGLTPDQVRDAVDKILKDKNGLDSDVLDAALQAAAAPPSQVTVSISAQPPATDNKLAGSHFVDHSAKVVNTKFGLAPEVQVAIMDDMAAAATALAKTPDLPKTAPKAPGA